MSTQETQGTRATSERLPLIFIGIVTVEILAILALYLAGAYFAS